MASVDSTPTLLVVDEQPEVIRSCLQPENYQFVSAIDGPGLWEQLERCPEQFDAVVLDRTTPDVDAMDVVRRMKGHPVLSKLPVILQTSIAAKADLIEEMAAGADYHVTKPFDPRTLRSILHTAVDRRRSYRELEVAVAECVRTVGLMRSGRFEFRTLDDARALASLLANTCPDPARASTGLSELMVNAVEHGNLGISYAEKTELMEHGDWLGEVERRLELPENSDKIVEVTLTRDDTRIEIVITDQGKGFDWQPYISFDPERAFDIHGRGIAMSKLMSFDAIEYRGTGNQVAAEISIEAAPETPRGQLQ